MQVIDDLKASTVQGVVWGEVALESEIDSDDSTSYEGFGKMVAAHRPKVIPKQELAKALP
uniref:Uncharacterized protein n=1 Tax=Sphingobacterium sp. (strain 21) TaxID=743722 RepID=F4CD58_SPHS2